MARRFLSVVLPLPHPTTFRTRSRRNGHTKRPSDYKPAQGQAVPAHNQRGKLLVASTACTCGRRLPARFLVSLEGAEPGVVVRAREHCDCPCEHLRSAPARPAFGLLDGVEFGVAPRAREHCVCPCEHLRSAPARPAFGLLEGVEFGVVACAREHCVCPCEHLRSAPARPAFGFAGRGGVRGCPSCSRTLRLPM